MQKVRIDVIIDYFENHYDFDFKQLKEPIQLEPAQKIIDLQKFLYNHISILKANSGKSVYLPYYYRLLKVYYISKL